MELQLSNHSGNVVILLLLLLFSAVKADYSIQICNESIDTLKSQKIKTLSRIAQTITINSTSNIASKKHLQDCHTLVLSTSITFSLLQFRYVDQSFRQTLSLKKQGLFMHRQIMDDVEKAMFKMVHIFVNYLPRKTYDFKKECIEDGMLGVVGRFYRLGIVMLGVQMYLLPTMIVQSIFCYKSLAKLPILIGKDAIMFNHSTELYIFVFLLLIQRQRI